MNINFPTSFAINIAKQNKLYTNKAIPPRQYPEEEPVWRVSEKAGNQHERLAMFQSVSISQTFKESLKIYLGLELSKKQIKALRKIHKATPLWIKGKMITEVIEYGDNENISTDRIISAVKMLGMLNEDVC